MHCARLPLNSRRHETWEIFPRQRLQKPLFDLGPPGTRRQPRDHHGMRRSPAAWQAVSFDGAPRKGDRLFGGSPLLGRQSHPLANDGASCLRFQHLI